MWSVTAVLLLASANVVLSKEGKLLQQWEGFKMEFGKEYKSLEEEQHRLDVFAQHVDSIAKHNKRFEEGLETFTQKINQFSDLTFEEFSKLYLVHFNSSGVLDIPEEHLTGKAPATADWRPKGAVTRVKQQGQCGSCWAFASTGSLEGQLFVKTGQLVELSEQNFVDCSKSNHGCEGGWMDYAYSDMQALGGVNSEATYPYEAVQRRCRFKSNAVVVKVAGYYRTKQFDEGALQQAVGQVGPVSVAIDITHKWQHYQGGVFYDPSCKQMEAKHAVLVVGYNHDSSEGDYWIVKNSWDSSWGNNGYIHMARNRNNHCGIATRAIYPKV